MRALLLLLLTFIALSATICGLIMIVRPDGSVLNLSISLLEHTAFKDFLIPGTMLAFVVGGTNMLAIILCLRRHPNRYNWSIAGGLMISGWIIGQMVLIQAISWLHFLFLFSGIMIILVSYQLKGKWAV
jgi:hypothetical protein